MNRRKIRAAQFLLWLMALSVTFAACKLGADIETIQAHKEAAQNPSYTVTFNTNGGSPVPAQTVKKGGKAAAPEGVTRHGYTLVGWYKEAALANQWDFATDTVSKNTTLYAKWNQNPPNTHTVTFVTNGGTHVPDQAVITGEKATAPEGVTKDRHTFEGWYIDNDTFQYQWNFNTPVAGDIILYAKWVEELTYAIELRNTDSGTALTAYTFAGRTPLTVTVANTGTGAAGTLTVGNSNTAAFTASPTAIDSIAANGSGTFSVTPSGTLTPGTTHTATITVSGGNGISASFTVSYTEPISSAAELTDHLAALPDNGPDTPYTLALNVSDVTGVKEAITASGKYVSLDLSGSPLTSIEDWAFYDCRNLTSVTIPEGVTSIGDGAFYDCRNLASVTIPDSVTSIESVAFWGCNSLASITIPEGVTSIGGEAFHGCPSLTAIDVAADNTAYSALDGILYTKDGKTLVQCPAGKTGTITIPDSVTGIGEYAFIGCSSLTSVTIPDSVTSIWLWAFAGCSGLASVTIPDSVTSIGEGAFIECTSLASVTIGNGVTIIGDSVFCFCTSLTSVTIPDSVTSIGRSAFSGCSSLTSVTFADTISADNFSSSDSFPGDLRAKYLAGGIGTYTTTAPVSSTSEWTKQ